ncbi:MAG: hypothetical protein OEY19_12305, partial [Gammaproteobacteria bacterium]|nr:hypothetical protein [Gammaproteobacteria bacterium]
MTVFFIRPALADGNTFRLTNGDLSFIPVEKVQFLEVSDNSLEDDYFLQNQQQDWKTLDGVEEFAYDQTYWFKIQIENDSTINDWLISAGFWYQATFYFQNKDLSWNRFETGALKTSSERQYPGSLPLVKIPLIEGMNHIMVKVDGFRHGRKISSYHIRVMPEKDYLDEMHEIQSEQIFFVGMALAIGGFHLILWFWLREKTYLWLVASAIACTFYFIAVFGIGIDWLWPESPLWNDYASVMLSSSTMLVYMYFGASFLRLKEELPLAMKAIYFLSILIFISIPFGLTKSMFLITVKSSLIMIPPLVLIASAINLAYRKFLYAWFYIIGNIFLLVSLIVWPIIDIGSGFSSDSVFAIARITQFSIAVLGILLALGMVERMQSMRQAMLQQALENERQRSEEERQTKALIQAQNIELESSNKALKELDILKDDFLARTSHELNTPLSGIIGLSQILLDDKIDLTDKE